MSGKPQNQRYLAIRRITLVGAVLDFTLGVAKVVGGVLGSSQALVADGIHSFSDLITDFMVIVAAKHAHAEADDEHPYGHGRIETVATVGLGLALIAVAVGIAYDAITDLFSPAELGRPAPWALAIAAFSVVSKEGMYHYTMRYAKRWRSSMLRANAWHTRSDAASSVVVIIGVGGTLLGLGYLDAVAAALVAWMVGRMGYRLAKRSVEELIDTGLDPAEIENIREIILSVTGVRDLHLLRTRQMAGRAFIDVHIILDDPKLSVSEGHQISETVRARLINRMDDVEDVTVHIDPEDDEHIPLGKDLGLRKSILDRLEPAWREAVSPWQIKRVNLHYLNGQVHVELELPLAMLEDGEEPSTLRNSIAAVAKNDATVASIRLLYSG